MENFGTFELARRLDLRFRLAFFTLLFFLVFLTFFFAFALGLAILNYCPLPLTFDGTTRTFAGTRIRLGTLTANRETTAMPQPAITRYVAKSHDVLRKLTPQLPFHDIVAFEERCQAPQFVLGELTRLLRRFDACFVT